MEPVLFRSQIFCSVGQQSCWNDRGHDCESVFAWADQLVNWKKEHLTTQPAYHTFGSRWKRGFPSFSLFCCCRTKRSRTNNNRTRAGGRELETRVESITWKGKLFISSPETRHTNVSREKEMKRGWKAGFTACSLLASRDRQTHVLLQREKRVRHTHRLWQHKEAVEFHSLLSLSFRKSGGLSGSTDTQRDIAIAAGFQNRNGYQTWKSTSNVTLPPLTPDLHTHTVKHLLFRCCVRNSRAFLLVWLTLTG